MKLTSATSLIYLTGLAAAQSLTDVLSGEDNLSQLSTLVEQAGIGDVLPNAGPVTILAPTNQAFQDLSDDDNGVDLTNQTVVSSLLQYHIIEGAFESSEIEEGQGTFAPTLLMMGPFAMLDGAAQVVNLVRDGEDVTVYSGGREESSVTEADITFDGGVIHKIDTALTLSATPSVTASQNDDLSTLADALSTASLVQTLDTTSNVTIFAPTNAAFEGMDTDSLSEEEIAEILQYHVIANSPVYYSDLVAAAISEGDASVSSLEGTDLEFTQDGDDLLVNGNQIITANVITSNGVIHIIDGVLSPDNSTSGGGAGGAGGSSTTATASDMTMTMTITMTATTGQGSITPTTGMTQPTEDADDDDAPAGAGGDTEDTEDPEGTNDAAGSKGGVAGVVGALAIGAGLMLM